MKLSFTIVSVAILIIFQLPLIQPFFNHGNFPSHDGNFHIIRIFEYFQSLKYGQFPPRLASGLLQDYSYPIFVFYPPLTYFLGAILIFLGFNVLIATKLLYILGFLMGSIGVFFFLRSLIDNLPALTGSLIYSLIPYRAVELYVRGDLAEFLAYSFFPWLLWTNLKFLKGTKNILNICILSLFITILVILHNLSAFIYSLFLIILNLFYLFFSRSTEKVNIIKGLFLSVILAILLSTFYWLPLIIESQYVRINKLVLFPYSDYFLTFQQLWQSRWGYAFPLEKDAMSLQLGQILIIISLLTTILNIFIKTKHRKFIFLLSTIFSFSTILETRTTNFIWENIPILHFLQFPWRFHILNTFCGALLAGFFFYLLMQIKLYKSRFGKILLMFLAGFFIFLSFYESFQFFKPKSYSSDFLGASTTTWNDEYMPIWVKTIPQEYTAQKITASSQSTTIKSQNWGYNKKSFNITNGEDEKIRIAQIYYPGWEAYVNNKIVPISFDNDKGLMEIKLPKGTNYVSFVFQRTWWRLLADITSIVGVTILFFLSFISIINQRKVKLSK